MAPRSQEAYVRGLLDLPLTQATKKLWADGWVVAIERSDGQGSPATFRDEDGRSFHGKERAGKRLATLRTEGDRIVSVSFYDTNTTTGEAITMPINRIFVR